jgi:hypothetical protein
MKTFLAVALGALTLGIPVAAADQDGYQPRSTSADPSDVLSRYLEREGGVAPTDVVDRAVANRARAVPQDAFDRAPVVDRPTPSVPFPRVSPSAESSGLAGGELAAALLLALALGAAAAVLSPLGRRAPLHRYH